MESEESDIVNVDFLPVLVVCLLGLITFIWLLHLGGTVNIGKFIQDNPGPTVALIGSVFTGTLGVWGVSKTLETNARNTRLQKEREIRAEREGVRAALLGELAMMQISIWAAAAWWEAIREGKIGYLSLIKISDLGSAYRALLPKIHLLEKHEVASIVSAHAFYIRVLERIAWLEAQFDEAKASGELDEMVRASKHDVDTAQIAIEDARRDLGGTPVPPLWDGTTPAWSGLERPSPEGG
jgi:hypothetical protein